MPKNIKPFSRDRRILCAVMPMALVWSMATRAAPVAGASSLLLFGNAIAGKEDEFLLEWRRFLTHLTSISGVESVEDFRRAPVTLRAGAEPLPPYLAVIRLSSGSAAPVVRQLHALPKDAGSSFDKSSLRVLLYRDDGHWPAPRQSSAKAHYLQIVLADAVAGQAANYLRWYHDNHGPELAKVPGVVAVDFGIRAAMPPSAAIATDGPAYLSAMRFETDDIALFKDGLEQAAKTSILPSQTYDIAHAWRETYQRIGDVMRIRR